MKNLALVAVALIMSACVPIPQAEPEPQVRALSELADALANLSDNDEASDLLYILTEFKRCVDAKTIPAQNDALLVYYVGLLHGVEITNRIFDSKDKSLDSYYETNSTKSRLYQQLEWAVEHCETTE